MVLADTASSWFSLAFAAWQRSPKIFHSEVKIAVIVADAEDGESTTGRHGESTKLHKGAGWSQSGSVPRIASRLLLR